jgi:hypothetical protein
VVREGKIVELDIVTERSRLARIDLKVLDDYVRGYLGPQTHRNQEGR